MLELTNSLFYLISKTEGGCSGNRKYMIIETALYQDVLEHSSIFRQLPKDKYPNVLRCLNARVVDYPQDASIAALGDSSGCSGILLTGMLEEYLVDENGNQIIINHLRSGDVFGAESVCAGQVASHVYIHTVEKSKILMLDFAALLSEKTFSCSCRMQVTTNLMQEFARQVLAFNMKVRILGQKRLRDRLKIYLQTLTPNTDGVYTLPYSRAALADFLCVDRSALSRELCRMRDEGILSFSGSKICMLDSEFLHA